MNLLEEIQELETEDLPEYRANTELIKEQLAALEKEIETLEKESLGENSPHLKSIIAKEAEKIEQDYKSRLALLGDKKHQIAVAEAENRAKLLAGLSVDPGCETTLKVIYEIIQEYCEKLDTSNVEGLRVPVETQKQLRGRAIIFEKHYDTYKEVGEPFCKKIAEKFALKDIFKSINNPKVAIGCMTAYVLVGVISVLYLPVVAIASYVAMTALSVRDALRLREDKLAIEKEFWLLEKSYENLEASYREEFKRQVQEANDKADKDYEKALKEYADEEATLKEDYHNLLKELEIMERDPNFIARNLSIYKHKLEGLNREKEEYIEQLAESDTELNGCLSDIDKLKIRLQSLRKQIEEKYMGELNPGDSRLLNTNLFLGFEKDEALRVFDFKGDSSVIFYSGESSDVTELSMSIFLELLREVNIASLSFYIMDTNMGAPEFMPFTQKELSEVITICSTKDQCVSVLNQVHSMLEERNRNILAYASNIEDFNKQMLEKNSLTREYLFLIIQESSGAILNNPKFQQICKSGYRVGIIPIVFISASWYLMQLKGEGEEAKSAFDLLSSIKNNWFSYSIENDAFIKRPSSFIESNMKRLEAAANTE